MTEEYLETYEGEQGYEEVETPSPAPVPEEMLNLPVQFTFTLAAEEVSMMEFARVTQGYFLDSNIDLNGEVEIKVNGKKYGTGRLIQIGHRIGVQVEQWPSGE
ncbi:FliM/FliN family flagellar motor switch protein [Epibacterium ulvae]|uniref:FliM/FliN family flagellar motor switch protein n=1 Tax=Epibacterium ulvae TaxID=1156985 RepID=UPI00248FBF5C|nr:FliM/FliN family flagellar motor switch protein [Epibacterium ulvae]